MWRKFLVGLRILDRVKQYKYDDDEQDHEDIRNEMDDEMARFEQDEFAGGFLPEDNVPNSGFATNNNHNGGSPQNWDFLDFGNIQVPKNFDPVVGGYGSDGFLIDSDSMGGGFTAEDHFEFQTRNSNFAPNITTDHEHAEASNRQEPVEDVDNKHGQKRDALEKANTVNTFERQSSPHTIELEALQNCQPLNRSIAKSSNRSNSSQSSSSHGSDPAETLRCDAKSHKVVPTTANENSVDELRTDTDVDADDEYDRSSLPSHDPDDEDADPEWLL